MNHTLALLLFLFTIATVSAQGINARRAQGSRPLHITSDTFNPYPDSIRVEFPDQQALVVFETKRFRTKSIFIENFGSFLKDLNTTFEKSLEDADKFVTPPRISVHVAEDGTQQIAIEPRQAMATTLTVKRGEIQELLPPGWEIMITTPDTKVYMYTASLSGLQVLAGQDYKTMVATIKELGTNYYAGRKSVKARLIVKAGEIAFKEVKISTPLDMLVGNARGNVGLLGDRFYPELGGSIGIDLYDRFNKPNQRIEFSYSSMYLPERSAEGVFTNNISSFLSVSYSRNFNTRGDRPVWTGVGAGLLVQEVGNYFKGNTMRFFFISDMGHRKLNIVPEFYLTEDFKKFQFGMKLQYSF